LSVAFDLPTQTGYDADSPLARGEVGKVGVPISHIEDMDQLFDQIPLDQMNTSMTINATAPWLLALYIALAQRRGIDPKKLSGTTQNDIIKEYLSRGTYIYPPGPSMRLIADTINYTVSTCPSGTRPISAATTCKKRVPRRCRSWPMPYALRPPCWTA
jgi:(2R)-ethylmalonyl-CoA mutase